MNFSYITILSNWLQGYDRYSNIYSKQNIPKSTYPNEFYLLKDNELHIGINKAEKLLYKLSNPVKNRIIRIETYINYNDIAKNTKNGLGWVLQQNYITVQKLYILIGTLWVSISSVDLSALAFDLVDNHSYCDTVPRSLSILPVAQSCPAKCLFCFSESSISIEQKRNYSSNNLLDWCQKAKDRGAERFVITGGGEPTLLNPQTLETIIEQAKTVFNKVVLISNGFTFIHEKYAHFNLLQLVIDAGVNVLCISRHHHSNTKNYHIMKIDSNPEQIFKKASSINPTITTRLICVLQKHGVDSIDEIVNYLSYATAIGVNQVCFKELYIATSHDSIYQNSKENQYSKQHQISLSVVLQAMNYINAAFICKLPWGSPVFEVFINNKKILVSAYTEPSVGWELSNRISRSWNIMSDGKCFSSLETTNSEITL